MLAVHLARLLSVLMGAATVWLTYRIALELFPDRPWLALGAAAVNAFTPMFIFISGAVNNDNLTMTLCSLGLLLIVKRVRENEGSGIRDQVSAARELPIAQDFFYRFGRWLPLGIVLGLGALTKTSALALLPITGLAVSVVRVAQRIMARILGGRARDGAAGAAHRGLVVSAQHPALWRCDRHQRLHRRAGQARRARYAAAIVGRALGFHAELLGPVRRRQCADR